LKYEVPYEVSYNRRTSLFLLSCSTADIDVAERDLSAIAEFLVLHVRNISQKL